MYIDIMRVQFLFLLIFTNLIFSQNSSFLDKISSEKIMYDEKIIHTDMMNNIYYLSKSELSKNKKLFFSDFSLGDISKVDLFNPLKLKVWYKDYNIVVILDNFLNEILRVNFNNLNDPNEISHVSSSNENTIWVFDQLSMKIKKFDYIENSFVKGVEVLLKENIMDMNSNYNFLWVLTKNYFYMINYNGTIISESKNLGFNKVNFLKSNILLTGSNNIYLFDIKDFTFQKINSEKLFIKDFFVVNETLYIYDEDFLNKYLILTN